VYDGTPDDPKIAKENREVLAALEIEQQDGEYRWSQLLKKDEVQTGRRVLLAYGMQFMNQMGGINLVVYYITSVLQINVGLTRNLSLLLGGVINMMFFFGSLYPTFYLDKSGRRKPMMWGSLGLGISMMMISILLSFQGNGGSLAKATSTASVAFFFTCKFHPICHRTILTFPQDMLIFGATVNCIPWVYVPEILPLHVRAKGTAIGISANWLWNFFVVMITPTIINNLQWKAYLIFMCLNLSFIPLVVSSPFSLLPFPFPHSNPFLDFFFDLWTGDGCVLTLEKYFCYPETANLTLEEIDWLFYEGKAVRRSRRVAKEGWGPGEGMARVRNSPTMLEEGRLENEREKMDGVEQVEGKAA
jgi:hypothetical protein